jgi:hypothetical protein
LTSNASHKKRFIKCVCASIGCGVLPASIGCGIYNMRMMTTDCNNSEEWNSKSGCKFKMMILLMMLAHVGDDICISFTCPKTVPATLDPFHIFAAEL